MRDLRTVGRRAKQWPQNHAPLPAFASDRRKMMAENNRLIRRDIVLVVIERNAWGNRSRIELKYFARQPLTIGVIRDEIKYLSGQGDRESSHEAG